MTQVTTSARKTEDSNVRPVEWRAFQDTSEPVWSLSTWTLSVWTILSIRCGGGPFLTPSIRRSSPRSSVSKVARTRWLYKLPGLAEVGGLAIHGVAVAVSMHVHSGLVKSIQLLGFNTHKILLPLQVCTGAFTKRNASLGSVRFVRPPAS